MLIRYKPGAGWQAQRRTGWVVLPRWAALSLLGEPTVAQYETQPQAAPAPTQEAA